MMDRPTTEKLVKNAYTGTIHQAYQFLQAVEMNCKQPLNDHCIVYLAKYIMQAWEPTQDAALLDELVSFMHSLPVRIPAHCPSLTLLLSIYYVDKLKQIYANIKGAPGCSRRLIGAAYTVASKYLHNNLQLIMNNRMPPTPPADTDPPLPFRAPKQATDAAKPQPITIPRMELELLHFLNYNLAVDEPQRLLWWAKAHQKQDDSSNSHDYTSGDEGDDELDDHGDQS